VQLVEAGRIVAVIIGGASSIGRCPERSDVVRRARAFEQRGACQFGGCRACHA
jgi:hypothetical protein